MRITLQVGQVEVLRNERGAPNAHAFVQADGHRLTVIGGVVLGVPTPLDANGVEVLFDPMTGDPLAPITSYAFDYPFPVEALEVLASRAVTRPVLGVADAALLGDDEFAEWRSGIAVGVGDVFRYAGVTYEVVQAHTTQSDWTPPAVPALWKLFRDPVAGPQPWVQPAGGHDAYQLGDRVTHNGSTWESAIADNVWEPGVFGWVVVP